MRKKWIVVAGLCIFISTAGIGCGTKEENPGTAVIEPVNAEEQPQTDEQHSAPAKDSEKKETELLDGNVRGIGDNGIVIIKTRTEQTEEEGVDLAIAPAPGNETAEDYVDVNFTDQTTLELRIVKNGGMNPDEDVTVKEASIDDIKGDMSVTIEGYYDEDVFIAEKVVLYEFL